MLDLGRMVPLDKEPIGHWHRLKRSIAKHLKLELDVLRGERCRICYAPLRDGRSRLCGCKACRDEAALQENHLDLSA